MYIIQWAKFKKKFKSKSLIDFLLFTGIIDALGMLQYPKLMVILLLDGVCRLATYNAE